MARRNIFEIMSEQFDLEQELVRIKRLFISIECVHVPGVGFYSVYNYVKYYGFSSWKNRGRCIDVDDFLSQFDYDDLWNTASYDIEDLFLLIEIIYNFWHLVRCRTSTSVGYDERAKNFRLLKRVMDDCLAQYNYKGEYFPELQQLIVVEDKPEITAVAEIVEKELAVEIIRYNHYALKGDLQNKKAILLRLASDLEPKRPDIKNINGPLEDGIFYILNNLNLRHNNTIAGDRYYRQAVVDMDESTLEEWYDELYQMMLLAYLQLDNVERNRKVKDLKKLITP